jgi:hypothetical protein
MILVSWHELRLCAASDTADRRDEDRRIRPCSELGFS